MQLLLIINCFYLSMYAVYFIRAAWTTFEHGAVVYIVCCPIPSLIVSTHTLAPYLYSRAVSNCLSAFSDAQCTVPAALLRTAHRLPLSLMQSIRSCATL
jgi:hypothetical protein